MKRRVTHPFESDKVWEGRALLYKILRLIKLAFFFPLIYIELAAVESRLNYSADVSLQLKSPL